MKLVLDTSVLISGVFWKGVPGDILDALIAHKFELMVTPPILSEYHRVLETMAGAHDAALVLNWSRFIVETGTLVEPVTSKIQCRDPNDQMFLECALGGHANLLVTGDKALLEIRQIEDVSIISPRAALKLL